MKYNRLTYVRDVNPYIKPSGKTERKALFLCDCGEYKEILHSDVKSGKSKSCGCLQKEKVSKANLKHGMSKSSEYTTWTLMKDRCTNVNNKSYSYYMGRGIKVCDRWLNSFESFYADMGKKPTINHQIDRVDNNKGYFPSNCRWATRKQNIRNTKASKRWVISGVCFLTLEEASDFCSVSYGTIYCRCNGWHGKGYSYPPKDNCYSYKVY